MGKKTTVSFKIDHLDPMGQGVYKSDDEIFFISGTLPGEEGEAQISASKKNIHFGYLVSPEKLTNPSPLRKSSQCEHFNECNGCHYLHTDYEQEVKFKSNSLQRRIDLYQKNIGIHGLTFDVIEATERLNYRSRIQLHYDLSKKSLGFIGNNKKNIIEVPKCQILIPEIEKKLIEIYKDDQWVSLIPKSAPRQGHLEIILNSVGEVNIIFNGPYAHGGFTQVHRKMNTILQKLVLKMSKEHCPKPIVLLDLFGGSGNLSKRFSPTPTIVIDNHDSQLLVESDGHQKFIKQNLYSKDAPTFVQNYVKKGALALIDPPRSGLKNLEEFFPENTEVDCLIYVSCNPATMFRDLEKIPYYKIIDLYLVDLFPGTHHYEVVACLQKINK